MQCTQKLGQISKILVVQNIVLQLDVIIRKDI